MLSHIVRSNTALVLKAVGGARLQRTGLKQMPARSMSYIHNLHQPPTYYVNGVKHINDFDVEEYRPQIRAFLTKRRTVKREVPPKVSIIKDLGEDYLMDYFQQRLVPGEFLYEEAQLKRLYDADMMNSQYIHTVFCEEYEKNLIEAVLQKKVTNGSVPSILDKPKNDQIGEQCQHWVDTFYKGDKLSVLETDIERMYISEKLDKHHKYQKSKSFRYKVRWTVSDFNRYQDQANYKMNDQEYFGQPKPSFVPFDLDAALQCMYVHQDIEGTSWFRRKLSYFTDVKNFERGEVRSQLQAHALLQRMLLYIDSWEFVNSMDVPNDFHINHSIANMHVWLMYQRLRDFSENKFAFQLREELIETFNKMTNEEMEDVDVLRKAKKIEDIDNYMYAIRRNFDFHFFINGKSADNPYYKLDALVWSCIFHEKVPRYSDQVYRMSEYFVQHFKYLKSVKFTDIEKADLDWCAYRVPFNYQNKVVRINPPLSEEEFEKEHDSSYKVKKYHYSFRREQELTDENLIKTYVNLCTNAFYHNKEKTVRQENLDLDSMNSEERELMIYQMKRELEEMSELPIQNESFFSKVNLNPTAQQFSIWKRNLFIPLTD